MLKVEGDFFTTKIVVYCNKLTKIIVNYSKLLGQIYQ